jgi:hypothetical protein
MKTNIKFTALTVLLSLAAAAGAGAAPGDLHTIAKDRVNLRQAPNTEAPIIMRLELGRKLLELSERGDWVKVGVFRAIGKVGWVHRSLLAPVARVTEPAVVEPPPPPPDPSPDRIVFVLELSGSPAMAYVGNCRLGRRNGGGRKVSFRGLIPKRYEFRGEFLNCRVQKFDALGRLKVRLYANGKRVAAATTAAPYNWVGVRGEGPWGRASGWRGNQRLAIIRDPDVLRSARSRGPVPPLSSPIVPPLSGSIIPPLQ